MNSDVSVDNGFQAKIACCTMDILRHLSGEELSRNLTKGTANDRLSTLASHILRQRRHVLC